MRKVLVCDLTAAAQILALRPALERAALLDSLLDQAHAADLYARRFGRLHPVWGNGSLMARALAERPQSNPPQDRDYWQSLSLVSAAIAARIKPAL